MSPKERYVQQNGWNFRVCRVPPVVVKPARSLKIVMSLFLEPIRRLMIIKGMPEDGIMTPRVTSLVQGSRAVIENIK